MWNKILMIFMCTCSLSVSAQNQKEVSSYFEQVLKGNTPSKVPSNRLSQSQIESARKQIWEAWKVSNKVAQSDALPVLDSLGRSSGMWVIPDSLEHRAAMPFYFGSKGSRPQGGFPFFLYLHGSGPKQQEWETGLILAKRFADAPSVYFIPQIPNEGDGIVGGREESNGLGKDYYASCSLWMMLLILIGSMCLVSLREAMVLSV